MSRTARTLPLLVTAVISGLVAAGCGAQDDNQSAPTQTSTTPAGNSPGKAVDAAPSKSATPALPMPTGPAGRSSTVRVPTATKQVAVGSTTNYLHTYANALRNPANGVGAAQETTIGPALDALKSMLLEYTQNKYKVTGKPTITGMKVIGKNSEATRLELAVCVDSSKVRVLDKHGEPVSKAKAAPRSLNLVTLVKHSGRWLVERTGFPSDPTC